MNANNTNKNIIKKNLIFSRQKYSNKTRVKILSEKISEVIKTSCNIENELQILDFGCGRMEMTSSINQILPTTVFTCSDIYDLTPNEQLPFEYIKYLGEQLPYPDDSFDVVILSDVLHHIPKDQQNDAIAECARLGKIVILKDHFEKGLVSRLILILMDIFGNWASGVKIPKRYFTRESFLLFCNKNTLECDIKYSEIALYDHLPSVIRIISPPNLHFIAVLKRKH